MRLLLDTHVAIWTIGGSNRLPETIATLIADRANEVAISIASLWEIAIKNDLGQKTPDPFPLSVEEAEAGFVEAGLVTLPIELRYLRVVEQLQRRHGDAFDRLLVATALADTYRLVTHDRRLAGYGDHVLLI